MNQSVLLKCEDLVFGYGFSEKKATGLAAPFNFVLSAGEVVALLGENGCGKSTFLKTACGLVSVVSGRVILEGHAMDEIPVRDRAKLVSLTRMGGVACDRMTVRDYVSLGRMPYAGLFDGRSAEDEQIVDESIRLLELEKFADRWVSELSDGERSRVYLAEAIAQQVKVLLLDEPNAFLDIPRSRKLFEMLRMLAKERRMGVIVSTHSVEYAEKYSDRIMVIENGIVCCAAAGDARAEGLLDWTNP